MPQQSWDDPTIKRLSHFLNNSHNIPRLFLGINATPSRDADLRRLFDQLNEFLTLEPTTKAFRFRVSVSIVVLFAAGILGAIVDIASSDRWYVASHDGSTQNLEILNSAMHNLGILLRKSREIKDQHQPGVPHLPTQDAEERIPRLFSKLWDHRHTILPLPLGSTSSRVFLSEKAPVTPEDRLESSVASAIMSYEKAFAASDHTRNHLAKPGQLFPKVTLEGALLAIHCLARTQQYDVLVSVAPMLTMVWVSSALEHILAPLWQTALADNVLCDCLRRQITARLRDENMVDLSLIAFVDVVLGFLYFLPRWDSADDWTQLFRSFSKAVQRQSCRGTMQEGMRHQSVITEISGVIRMLLLPTDRTSKPELAIDGRGYPGDISRLSVVSALAQASISRAPTLAHTTPLYDLLPSLQSCTVLVRHYQLNPYHRRRIERLVEEAAACVPSTIRALRAFVDSPQATAELRGPVQGLIEAWAEYTQAVGLTETTTANHPRVFLFRTCAMRTCLCNGEKPAHKLRVCAGCWQVFYCGKKCQTEDWGKWGHREWCRQQRAIQRVSSV